jgi:probable rRNA maturation factor
MPDGDPPQGRTSVRSPGRSRTAVTVSRGAVRVPLALARVQALAELVLRRERVRAAAISIQFVTARAIARLHAAHFGIRGPTDIVTLEHARGVAGAPVVGEVHIAPEVAAENAAQYGVSARLEVARLVVHGVLHALGWEHPDGAARTASPMWRRQEALLRAAQRAGVI